ncbi:hypothetical protein SBA3_2170012 [Candidatus Sulfopaludibacter sp. SbA3]|nr:hypothetical protein SBA3_2170012 [Candidatus Sulfopaludibacter sp. SbA3]
MGSDKDLPGLDAVFPLAGSESEAAFAIEHVVPWNDFAARLDARQSANPQLTLYLDSGGPTGGQMGDAGNPEGLAPVFNPYLLWKSSVHSRWPALAIKDAFPILDEIRQVKSTDEIAALRKAAAITAQAFWAAATAIVPGRTQRQIEGEVLRACLQAGSNGPSLWPWIRSGPNSLGSALFAALFDSTNLDRATKAGDIVRVDVGCDSGMYKGDLGRTVPVTGTLMPGRRKPWTF